MLEQVTCAGPLSPLENHRSVITLAGPCSLLLLGRGGGFYYDSYLFIYTPCIYVCILLQVFAIYQWNSFFGQLSLCTHSVSGLAAIGRIRFLLAQYAAYVAWMCVSVSVFVCCV